MTRKGMFIALVLSAFGRPPGADPPPGEKPDDATRLAGNVLFDRTGFFINDASAFNAGFFAPEGGLNLLKEAKVAWIALQIDNGGKPREDNVKAVKAGWMTVWRRHVPGLKVGFWGVPRGAGYDARKLPEADRSRALAAATVDTASDARLAARLTAELGGDFYLADCEGPFQDGVGDPALSAVYVDAFQKAAPAGLPRALSSMGRIALDMPPWIRNGWDALPQAYWNSYAHYQPSLSVAFYKSAGWPAGRIHPTIATYGGEGENRKVSLEEYAADLAAAGTRGFSYYLPESYLGTDPARWRLLGSMGR